MTNRPNLWWAYDPEDGSFSALPASPWLIPAMLLTAVVAVFRILSRGTLTTFDGHGAAATTPCYIAAKRRWLELIPLAYPDSGESALSLAEWQEYYRLQEYLSNPTATPPPDFRWSSD